ncbi:MAG: hypothetical protein BJ554DRAFT_4885, partial [Olpidium bornovanus]
LPLPAPLFVRTEGRGSGGVRSWIGSARGGSAPAVFGGSRLEARFPGSGVAPGGGPSFPSLPRQAPRGFRPETAARGK